MAEKRRFVCDGGDRGLSVVHASISLFTLRSCSLRSHIPQTALPLLLSVEVALDGVVNAYSGTIYSSSASGLSRLISNDSSARGATRTQVRIHQGWLRAHSI